MLATKDILNRIQTDFKENVEEATSLLGGLISKTSYINEDRVIRSVLFLAQKDITKLKSYIKAALSDPRDAVFWAEYTNHDDKHPTKINDFEKPFE
jgi:hypothetical protein